MLHFNSNKKKNHIQCRFRGGVEGANALDPLFSLEFLTCFRALIF